MNWRHPRVWIALASASAVLSLALVDLRRTTPGELSAIHARELGRAGEESCAACHGGLLESMTHACLDCHEEIDAQLEDGVGLHGAVDTAQAARCAVCHSEHHGAGFALVHRQSFALAGVPDPEAFDHGLVALTLEGRHLELACADCHEHADTPLLPEGAQRFLGLERGCGACHEDPHEGRMTHACASCHDQHDFAAPEHEGHARFLELVGGHGGLDCRACHAAQEPHALERLGRAIAPAARDCVACHDSPHGARFEGQAGGCIGCHAAAHERFDEAAPLLTKAQHAATGFALASPHDAQDCAACHAPDEDRFAARHPGRDADDCAACHGDPHAGQFAVRADADIGCLACHERARFEPHAFDRERHAQTRFPLTDAHREPACADCHQRPSADAARVFAGTPGRCEGCHADAHRGAFEPHADELAADEAGACAACHALTAFDAVPRERFDHGRWTAFALEGAHDLAECESCHEPSVLADDTGRRFGRAAVGAQGAGACRDCHADPHDGRFEGEELPQSVGGATGCARCHVPVSFRALDAPFDHGLWTGYALEDAHAQLACVACHPTVRSEAGVGRGPAAGARCASCHQDPHGGQFELDGAQDCERCHQSAADFTELVFDHDRHASFPLDGAHDRLECAACHKPFREEGVERVRYRPLGTTCADCHGTQRSRLRRRDEEDGRR